MKKWLLMVVLPLFSGLTLYLLFAPKGNWIESYNPTYKSPFPIYSFLVFNIPDGLWCLSFANAMRIIWSKESYVINLIMVLIAAGLAVFIEILQYFDKINGTFDIVDMGVELLFCCIPLYQIIKNR